jgi:hypothetical protein
MKKLLNKIHSAIGVRPKTAKTVVIFAVMYLFAFATVVGNYITFPTTATSILSSLLAVLVLPGIFAAWTIRFFPSQPSASFGTSSAALNSWVALVIFLAIAVTVSHLQESGTSDAPFFIIGFAMAFVSLAIIKWFHHVINKRAEEIYTSHLLWGGPNSDPYQK